MSQPVTVSITRRVDPDHEDQMLAWVRAGFELAARFEGFLGSGWVRPETGSTTWHMLYRFASAEHLEVWMTSSQRRWWLDSGRGFVDESKLERRTGIEGWFDEPTSVAVQDLHAGTPAPPRWKQAVAIFLGFWPVSVLINLTLASLLPDLWLPVRLTVVALIMVPLMTYLLLPWITRLLAPWLNAPRG